MATSLSWGGSRHLAGGVIHTGVRLCWLLAVAIVLVPGPTDLGAQAPSDPPPAGWQPTGARVTWRNISFIVPPGMSGAAQADLYEMGGPGMRGRGTQCGIIILGEMPARGDLATQAQDTLVSIMSGLKLGVADSQGGSNLIADRRVGRSADGWRYVELSGMVTPGVGGGARIMLIDRGATVIPIFAISAPGNGCVGLSMETTPNSNTITWAALFYSLRVAGAAPSDHLREQIIGGWGGSGAFATAQAGMVQEEDYAPNGRYGGEILGASPTGGLSSSGGGQYVVSADRLTIFPGRGTPSVHLIRIVEDYAVLTPSQSTVRLCKVRVDAGGPHERCLSRR